MSVSIIDHLMAHALRHPDRQVYTVAGDGARDERNISYGLLAEKVKACAYALHDREYYDKRVLLLFEDVLDFIVAFLVCQLLGIIAVPVPYMKGKKQVARLLDIVLDAGADAVFCTASAAHELREHLAAQRMSGRDQAQEAGGDQAQEAGAKQAPCIISFPPSLGTAIPIEVDYTPNSISFIQYTSGSTGKPKGVVVSTESLLHNEQLIKDTFGCDEDSVIFCWLPPHHDMGLIGNILHTLYVGCRCIIMSPHEFIQSPVKWLQGISTYRATHSGAPNFAYDLCAEKVTADECRGLDLSSWRAAYNGSEPVRWETLNRFAACFADAGFSRQAFYPCYGLAEATLLVTGVKGGGDPFCFEKEGKTLVGSGRAPRGMLVKIIAMDTGTVCGDLEEGEICIHGESVTRGYWNADNRSIFVELAGDRYYKTGDLGFLLNGELFVSGRSKEMLIIRGRNFYPADIGEIVAQSHAAVDINGVAVFEWRQAEEEWIVVAEIKRAMLKDLRAEQAIDKIDRAIQGTYGFRPFDIVLTTPFSIPRTTSGKLQRLQCKDHYAQKLFKNLGTKRDMERSATVQPKNQQLIGAMIASPDKETIKQYLINLIGSKIESVSCDWSDPTVDLTEIGIDSIKAMELMNTINRDLSINIDGARLFRDRSLGGLIVLLENILWLKNAQPSGKEITI